MYKTSIPVMNHLVNKETRNKFLKLLKDAKAERVLLILTGENDIDSAKEKCKILKENGEFFKDNGIEPSIWIGNTIGHGTPLAGAELPSLNGYQSLVNLNGELLPDTNCPFDDAFCRETGEFLAFVIKHSGIKLLFLDDDYRLSQHGDEFCCACEKHMARICEILGENISREELKELAFKKEANKYRQAWLTAQKESLENLAHIIRKEVDKVDKEATVALCAAHSIWGVDGSSATDIAKILAGKNKAVARLHPAPYWAAHCSMPLPVVFELARMFAHFSKDSNTEILAEGDNYPRPRYSTPASYLELFDGVMRADGNHNGILKYMSDYVSSVDYEKGYFAHHKRDLPLLEKISKIFDNKNSLGVYTPVDRSIMEKADFSVCDAYKNNYPFPFASRMLSSLSIPTTLEEEHSTVTALFSQEALTFYKKDVPLLLDGVSAYLLAKNGIDVGIAPEEFVNENVPIVASRDDKHLIFFKSQQARFLKGKLNENASVKLYTDKKEPFAYTYRNPSGQKFAVCLLDTSYLPNDSAFFKGYCMQKFFIDAIKWLTDKKLPAVCPKNPDLYIIAKGKNSKTAVGLFNCYPDPVLKPEITLDKKYTKIKFFGTSGILKGNKVFLSEPLHPFSFCAFEVE